MIIYCEMEFICQKCGKKLKSQWGMTQHYSNCTGDPNWWPNAVQCEDCPGPSGKFKDAAALKAHQTAKKHGPYWQ